MVKGSRPPFEVVRRGLPHYYCSHCNRYVGKELFNPSFIKNRNRMCRSCYLDKYPTVPRKGEPDSGPKRLLSRLRGLEFKRGFKVKRDGIATIVEVKAMLQAARYRCAISKAHVDDLDEMALVPLDPRHTVSGPDNFALVTSTLARRHHLNNSDIKKTFTLPQQGSLSTTSQKGCGSVPRSERIMGDR